MISQKPLAYSKLRENFQFKNFLKATSEKILSTSLIRSNDNSKINLKLHFHLKIRKVNMFYKFSKGFERDFFSADKLK